MATKQEQALEALKILEEFIREYTPEPEPEPEPEPDPEPKPPTMARIIDGYFREKNYYPQVPYVPLGDLIVDICHHHTGSDPLWVDTMAAACEVEGGGKNVLGCDRGAIDCNKPVTRNSIARLKQHYARAGISNGVGPMQITWFPFIRKAEEMGGAHILRNSMTVGAQHLNDLLNRYRYLDALEMYNDGRPGNDPSNPYEVKFARVHKEWRDRLRKAVDYEEGNTGKPPKPDKKPGGWDPVKGSLAPPGFKPQPVRAGNYVQRNPTRFIWRPDVEKLVRDLYAEFGKYRIFINTYVNHPEAANPPRPNVSFDVWGGGSHVPGHRGEWLPADIGMNVWKFIWKLHAEGKIRIRWAIYHEKIYGVWNNFEPEPYGDGSQFQAHNDHIHITIDGPFQQIR